jgi:hypothetical protein
MSSTPNGMLSLGYESGAGRLAVSHDCTLATKRAPTRSSSSYRSTPP